MRKKVFFFTRILVTLVIFIALFKFVPYHKLIEVYRQADRIYLVYAFLIFWLSLFLAIARWKLLLSAVGVKLSFRETAYSYFSGLFLNLFFPSFLAGDFFRGFGIFSRHGKLKQVVSTVLVDRFSGGVALTLVAIIGFLFLAEPFAFLEILFCLLVLSLIIVFLLLIIFCRPFFDFSLQVFKKMPSVIDKISDLREQLCFFKKKPIAFCKALAISLLIQILGATGFFVASFAFNLNLNIIIFLAIIPIVMVLSFIPITIAGAGTREALTIYFLSNYGVAESVGLGISLVSLVYFVSAGLIGGLFYVAVYHRWLQSGS